MFAQMLDFEGMRSCIATCRVESEEAEMRRESGNIEGLQPDHSMAAAEPHGVANVISAAARTFQRQTRRRSTQHFRVRDNIIGVDSAEDEIRS